MGLQILRIDKHADFRELAKVHREAFEVSESRLLELIFPLNGQDDSHREAAIEQAAQRYAQSYELIPTAHWVKVVDDKTNELLGAALWNFYEDDPYASARHPECMWWPEGEERNIANDLLSQLVSVRMTLMAKPHASLNICFTAPKARRRGVATLLTRWGVEEADKRGYETYVDASDVGRHLYRKFGFVEEEPRSFSLSHLEGTDKVREMQRRLLPYTWWPMRRPARKNAKKCRVAVA